MLGLKRWILGKRWILAAMPYFRHCETSARKSWQSTSSLYHSQAAKPLAQQLISPRKWILGSGRVWLIALGLLGALQCMDARKSPQYITDSKDFSTIGIDRHDIEAVVEKTTRKLLESSFVRELQGQKLLAIADLRNLTEEDIDVEFLSRKITRTLRKSKKFTLTNAIAGSGSSTDNLLTDSRKLTKDKRFNQYTTQEDGTLLAPDLSLSGKIIQRTKSVGDRVRVDYDFLFVLTDLKSGRVVWDDEENIAKAIDKSQVARFSKLGAGSCDGGDVLACEREAQAALDVADYKRAQEIFHQACKLGSKQACENRNQVKKDIKNLNKYYKRQKKEQEKAIMRTHKEAKRQARIERREENGHGWSCIVNEEVGCFGISIGAEIGMGGGTANMVPLPYSYNDYNGVKHGLIIYDNKTPFKDLATWPYMLRAGIYYKQKTGIYLAANVLYGGYTYNAADSSLAFDCTATGDYTCIQINSLDFTHKLFGGGARIGFVSADTEGFTSIGMFIGGGALKDVGSTMKTQGTFIIKEELGNTFPFWEIGAIVTMGELISLETSYRHLFNGKDDKSWASIGAFNIGLGFLLPIW